MLDINGNAPTVAGILVNGSVTDSAHSTAALAVTGLIELGQGTVSANLGGTATLLKADADGAGPTTTAILSGTNSFSGTVIDLIGILNIQNSSALGEMSAGVFVVNGATLQLQGGIAVAAASVLFLQGEGVGGIGALDNKSDVNYWSGPILLDNGTDDTKKRSTAARGELSFLRRALTDYAPGSPITFGGGGDVTVANAGIGVNVGSVTKDDSGTLTLAADGSYTGGTTIEAGTVLDYGNGIPEGSSVTTLGGRLVLEFSQYSGTSVAFSTVLPAPGASGSLSASETLEITNANPIVTSINCAGNQLAAGATSLQFTVNFNEPVLGVNAGDFALTGGNSSGTISSVTGSGSSYTVTVTGVSGTGTLGLSLADNDTIINASGTPLGGYGSGNGNFTGQQYALSTQFYWQGGSGNFAAADWHVGGSSGPMLAWVNGADAIFPAGTTTVTIAGQLTANSLTFQGDGAILQGASSSDTLALLGSGNVTVSSGTAMINLPLVGSGGLTKLGSGTLDLGAANTFTGLACINAGALQFGDTAGSGAIDDSSGIDNYGTLSVAAGTTFNEYQTTYNYGTISCYGTIHCYGSVDSIGSIVNYTGGTVVVESGGSLAFSAEFDNYGSVEAAGGLFDEGAYASTGTTTIDGSGTFAAWAGASLSAAIVDNGSLAFYCGLNMTYDGAISGSGSVVVSGGAIMTLGGDNSGFTGYVLVEAGIRCRWAPTPRTASAAERRNS